MKKKRANGKKVKKISKKSFPTLKLKREKDIAMDFATKVYQKFDKLVKSIILFGSQVKNTSIVGSDIDIVIIVDDAAVQWDQELTAWYREELGKLIKMNPYSKELHINSVKLTTWWHDLMKGDPVIINILRFGESIIDFGGFFEPIKMLLQQGRIQSTPEAVYNALQRTPVHIARSKAAELNAIEGLYWAMVDSSQAALMAAKQTPPSPEHIPVMLKNVFVDKGMLKMKYVLMYRDLYVLHRKIIHGEITDLEGKIIDGWQYNTEQFARKMAELVQAVTGK